MTLAGLPFRGRPADEVLAELQRRHVGDLPTHGGRTWAYVYDSGLADLDVLARTALGEYSSVNGLDPTVFPSITGLENEVVGAAAALLGGDDRVVGTFTSGGTESCLLAVKAARDHAATTRGATTASTTRGATTASTTGGTTGATTTTGGRPELVLAASAHPAFHKAAHYFGLDVVAVPVDPQTLQADPAATAAAITERTVLVVASAPSYPYGVVDPVTEIAAAAADRGVLCHVDSCIGGWLLPYLRRDGAEISPFDFSVPGVTSMSVDLHKYGYTAKGASVLLFRDAALRRASYYASGSWPGYVFVNSTVQSTKSAGPLAAAWATMQHLGDDGYAALARRTGQATRELVAGITAIDGLRVLGQPQASLIAFTGDESTAQATALSTAPTTDPTTDIDTTEAAPVDVYVLADELRELGWYVQPQPPFAGQPANVHLTVTAASLPQVEPLLADLATALDQARTAPDARPGPQLLAAVGSLDPATLTPEQFRGLLAATGFDPTGPSSTRMATVNHLLDALPPPVRERVLLEFLGQIYGG